MYRWLAIAVLGVSVALPVLAESLRDPTQPPQPARTSAPAQQQMNLSLDSILVSDNRRVAVINGQSVSAGDSVGNARIQRIEADRVLVQVNGTTRTLRLETAPSVRQSQ